MFHLGMRMLFVDARRIKAIDLALQGGGAHGAFTWGVLDRILEDERLHIAGISGTSAGAMNTVALADGYATNGRKGAQQALCDFWRAVSEAARLSLMQRTPVMKWLGLWSLDHSPGYRMAKFFSNMFSPYQFNPLDINPLRDIVARQVNFDRVHACSDIELFVSATNVRTGRAKVFDRGEITLDAVMASACLPQIFHAVEIDGEAYWDGGYMGNPVLFPLVDKSKADDIIIVQINPIFRHEIPRTATDITNLLNEITFNASLTREISSILLLQQLIDEECLSRVRYTQVRLHRIRIVLASQSIPDKENEISAIPDLLSQLDLKGAVVTIDAMGCQKTIAKAIVEQKADYVLTLKENPPTFAGNAKARAVITQISPAAWRHILLNGHYTFQTDGKMLDLDTIVAALDIG